MHSRSIKAPTKAERRRLARIVDLGCLCCREDGNGPVLPAEVHHLLDGGVRRGHAFTIALCQWHHRGVPMPAWLRLTSTPGPSLAQGSRPFRAWYGSDDALLRKQEDLLALSPEPAERNQ